MSASRRLALVLSLLASTSVVAIAPSAARAEGMESPGLFGAGLFFTGAGAAGLVTGGYFFDKGSGACDALSSASIPTEEQVYGCRDGVIQQVGGVVGLVTGGAFVLAGLPMMIVGGSSSEEDPAPAQRVTLSVGPGSGAVTVSF